MKNHNDAAANHFILSKTYIEGYLWSSWENNLSCAMNQFILLKCFDFKLSLKFAKNYSKGYKKVLANLTIRC